jgi:hypothetical protein
MVRHSKKNRRGGANVDDIQSQLDIIQIQVNELKKPPVSVEEKEEIVEEEPVVEEKKVVDKFWIKDKTIKFNDGANGRVSLSFDRLQTLIDTAIKKGNTKKEWSEIKNALNEAESKDEVQDIITKYKISFASNYVAGTRRKKRHGKKRTSRR